MIWRRLRGWSWLMVALCSLGACKTASGSKVEAQAEGEAGALIEVSMHSRVGVLLDEIPIAERDRVATIILKKDPSYWDARARRQVDLTAYRLRFRGRRQGSSEGAQLPLPPAKARTITLSGPARRESVDGHDYVLVDYQLEAYLISSPAAVEATEPSLASIGGAWREPFVFPVDPELLVQRTGFACMNEAGYPRGSLESEVAERFYDHQCSVEGKASENGCHQTQLPPAACDDALKAQVGRYATHLDFIRRPWDEGVADQARVDLPASAKRPDLQALAYELQVQRIVYRYIPPQSCAVVEQCVGAPGWRRLLLFNAAIKNTGGAALHLGSVEDMVAPPKPQNSPTSGRQIFTFSPCLEQYQLRDIAALTMEGVAETRRRKSFCLESSERDSNHEGVPLSSPYSCKFQGLSPGWIGRQYAGLDCQWFDITEIKTDKAPVTRPMTFRINPDGQLCEGQPKPGAPNSAPSMSGTPPQGCAQADNWDANNAASALVTVPRAGEGMITANCEHGQLGPKRNCGFSYEATLFPCQPGSIVTVQCSAPAAPSTQVLRLCTASAALHAGTACTYSDALANAVVGPQPVRLSFTCPKARDERESAGLWSAYMAPLLTEDQSVPVRCQVHTTD